MKPCDRHDDGRAGTSAGEQKNQIGLFPIAHDLEALVFLELLGQMIDALALNVLASDVHTLSLSKSRRHGSLCS